MGNIDIEVIKKEIIDKVDKLGDSYSTFSFKDKIVVNHEVERIYAVKYGYMKIYLTFQFIFMIRLVLFIVISYV